MRCVGEVSGLEFACDSPVFKAAA